MSDEFQAAGSESAPALDAVSLSSIPVPHASPDPGPGEGLAAAMADAWRRGDFRPAEHLLGPDPERFDPPEAAIRLIYEEVCLRQERGEEVTPQELRRRFPRWADELA